jgi:hypothetical protein
VKVLQFAASLAVPALFTYVRWAYWLDRLGSVGWDEIIWNYSELNEFGDEDALRISVYCVAVRREGLSTTAQTRYIPITRQTSCFLNYEGNSLCWMQRKKCQGTDLIFCTIIWLLDSYRNKCKTWPLTSVSFFETTRRNNPEDCLLKERTQTGVEWEQCAEGYLGTSEEVTGGCRKLHREKPYNLHSSRNIIRVIEEMR